jgi:ribosomal protein S18 acetylase RimI-like enzyme
VGAALTFRPALAQDIEYCRRIYFSEMEWIIRELHIDALAQAENFQKQWVQAQVRIITLQGTDIGWLQSFAQDDDLFLAQLVVDRAHQRKGIGTEVMERLMHEAQQRHQGVRLEVVKINPALRLYQRLGFRITGEDDRKWHMKRDADAS